MAALRSSSSGPLHLCPARTGLFRFIMSPQYLFEITFYGFMTPLVGIQFIFPFFFTLANQTGSALYTFRFYKEKFSEEIQGRKAIIPFLL